MLYSRFQTNLGGELANLGWEDLTGPEIVDASVSSSVNPRYLLELVAKQICAADEQGDIATTTEYQIAQGELDAINYSHTQTHLGGCLANLDLEDLTGHEMVLASDGSSEKAYSLLSLANRQIRAANEQHDAAAREEYEIARDALSKIASPAIIAHSHPRSILRTSM